MRINRTHYALTKRAAYKGIRDMQENPERGIRNLIDLGDRFASGAFQKVFFRNTQKRFADESSVYYDIAKCIFHNTSAEMLVTCGMNIGYNSWTYGAAHIRETEEKMGFNIPWTLIFDLRGTNSSELQLERLTALFVDGKELGIFNYMFRLDYDEHDLIQLLYLLKGEKDCVFVMYVEPECITEEVALLVAKLNTVCLVMHVKDDNIEAVNKAVANLKNQRCLFGGYMEYGTINNADAQRILENADEMGISIFFFLQDELLTTMNGDIELFDVDAFRDNLNAPVFPIDLYSDIAMVDSVISTDACIAVVYRDGTMTLVDMEANAKRSVFSMQDTSLADIFKHALPKQRT